jgi:heme exporter protein A
MTREQAAHSVALAARALVGGRAGRRLFGPLDFALEPGALIELRGPNGAGKSTLLLILAGLLPALSGNVDFTGHDPESPRPVALLGHRNAVRARLSPRETLAFFSALETAPGLSPEAALAAVGLERHAGRDAGQLSQGQTRRLAFARLLVAPRPIWLLDEPMAGIDAEGETRLGALIADHVAMGGAVIAATHADLPHGLAGTRIDLGATR